MFSFFAGVLVYRLWSATNYRPQVPNVLFPILLLSIFALVPPNSLTAAYDLLAVIIAFPLLIYGAASNNPNSGRLQTTYTTLGLASYAVYVIHWPIYELLERVRRHAGQQDSTLNPIWGVVLLVALVLIALTLDRFYDFPVRKRLNALLLPRPLAKAKAEAQA
jgi:peptidoglycan/LPS O-acetylase OafA/YrhL